jgi:hypothetical protein
VPLRTIAAIWSWAPALSGKRYSVSKRFDGPHSDSGRFYSYRWSHAATSVFAGAQKGAVPRHYTAALLVWLCIEFVDGTYPR